MPEVRAVEGYVEGKGYGGLCWEVRVVEGFAGGKGCGGLCRR